MGYKINIRNGSSWDNLLQDSNIDVVDANNNFTSSGLDGVLDELYNSSGGLSWSTTTVSVTASSGKGYFADTSGNTLTITLPVTAASGDKISISDYSGNFKTNNCIIDRNGHKIMGISEDFVCDFNNLSIDIVYVDTTQGWRLTSTSDGNAGSKDITWSTITTNTTATNGKGYFADTSSNTITITLPTTVSVGDEILISDYSGSFETNNCTIDRNGHKIMGVSEDFVCDFNNLSIRLVYADNTQGWRLTSTSDGNAGNSVPTGGGVAQVLSKKTSNDIDIEWVDPTPVENDIINGTFDIWQRASSQSGSTTSYYGSVDRWANVASGSTSSISRQSFGFGQTDVPGNPRRYHRTVVTSTTAAANYSSMFQNIVDVSKYSGKRICITFYAKADSSKNIAVECQQNFGVGGSSGITSIGVTTISLSTTWTKHTLFVDVPSISGKTIPSLNNSYFKIRLWFDAGSNWNSRTNSLGNQSGTFDVSEFTSVINNRDVPVRRPTYDETMEFCQRYYWNNASGSIFLIGSSYGSAHVANNVTLPVKMRSNPTMTVSGTPAIGGTGVQAHYVENVTADKFRIRVWTSATTQYFQVTWGNTTSNGRINMDAEI